jgi:predicted RNA-binding Zn-ribbon protein involved in translation (DUF1610 family)
MKKEPTTREQWLRAYDDMMNRIKTAIEEAEESTLPVIRKYINKAKDTAVELEELSKDEAEKLSIYVQRDIEDAGRHLAETGHELGDWLRFDASQIEDRLLGILTSVADRTKLELQQFEHEIEEGPAWNTGEITGPGTLVCESCGEHVRFHATGEIPNCPKCGHTVFHRQHKPDAHQ